MRSDEREETGSADSATVAPGSTKVHGDKLERVIPRAARADAGAGDPGDAASVRDQEQAEGEEPRGHS